MTSNSAAAPWTRLTRDRGSIDLVLLGRRVGELLLFAVMPLYLNVGVLIAEHSSRGGVAYDFKEALLPAARAVADGSSPYGPATAAAVRNGTAFVYPPAAAYLFVPITWIPAEIGAYAISVLVLACVAATLWVLGVRDWRCYGASAMWPPVVYTVRLGALSLPLALLTALAWRHRGRVAVLAGALAGAIALKLFLWPLLVWLVATRRWTSFFATVVATIAIILIPWAALGFAGLSEYPHLLRVLSSIEAPDSYTVTAIARKAGLAWRIGEVASYSLGLALCARVLRAGRQGDDRASFLLALTAALVLSPIVWIHYFVLLLVIAALLRPTFGIVWLLPMATFTLPISLRYVSLPQLAVPVAIAGAMLLVSKAFAWTSAPEQVPATAPAASPPTT